MEKSQMELSLLACKNYLKSGNRDAFLIEVGRLQVWAIVFPELLEREEYKDIQKVFDSIKICSDRIDALNERLANDIESQTFFDFYSSLSEDIEYGRDTIVREKVSRHFSYLFERWV